MHLYCVLQQICLLILLMQIAYTHLPNEINMMFLRPLDNRSGHDEHRRLLRRQCTAENFILSISFCLHARMYERVYSRANL